MIPAQGNKTKVFLIRAGNGIRHRLPTTMIKVKSFAIICSLLVIFLLHVDHSIMYLQMDVLSLLYINIWLTLFMVYERIVVLS